MTKIKQMLRRLFVAVYYRFFRIGFGRYEKRHRADTKRRLAAGQALRVLFIIQYPEMWNSEKTLVDALLADDAFEPILLCVPKYRRLSSGKVLLDGPNEAYEFLTSLGYQPVDASAAGVSLRALAPDFVFVQRPYAVELPAEYDFRRIHKVARLCYIPYSGRMTRGIHVSNEFNKPFLRTFSLFFADGRDSFDFVSDWSAGHGMADLQHCYQIGFPRFDRLKEQEPESDAGKAGTRFLWLPRWTLDEHVNVSHFLDYIEPMLAYFAARPECELIIRPHPLMFTNFVRVGAMTEEQVQALRERIDAMPNVSFDPEGDYLRTFRKADVLIADVTSLLLEFFFTRKPVILCDALRDLTQEGERIERTFYKADSFEEIEEAIRRIEAGDPLAELRETTFRELNEHQQNAANNIREALLKEAVGERYE